MLHERSSLGARKVSPPTPVFMSSERKASYLADLRTNRPTRPAGSRPLPSRPSLSTGDENVPPRAGSALSLRDEPSQPIHNDDVKRHTLSKRASMPAAATMPYSNSFKGRPLVQSPGADLPSTGRKVSPESVENAYRESTARAKEKQEAHALREALLTIDKRDEEKRLHEAAKSEASDLVWRHRNPQAAEAEKIAPFRNPDLSSKKYGDLAQPKSVTIATKPESLPNSRSSSSESTDSQKGRRRMLPWLRKKPKPDSENQRPQVSEMKDESKPADVPPRKPSGGRKISSGSTKALFRNPEDQIYEEPVQDEPETSVSAEHTSQAADPHVRQLHERAFRGTRPLPLKSQSLPSTVTQRQVRDLVSPIKEDEDDELDAIISVYRSESPETPMKDGLEIRSEEIRAATSMKKKDRSPNLPTPTAVSNRPGRPIVSFDPKWRASSESPSANKDLSRSKSKPENASIAYPVPDVPAVPTITIMDAPSHEPRLSNGVVSRLSENTPSANIEGTAEAKPSAAHSSAPARTLPTINLPDQDTDNAVPSINIENEPVPRPLPPTFNLPEQDTDDSIHSINIQHEASPRPLPPIINLPEQDTEVSVPSIAIQNDASTRPLPSPNAEHLRMTARPLPHHTQSAPSKVPFSRPPGPNQANRVPWLHRTPTSGSTTSVTCNACFLPISGRVVTASGSSTTAKKGRFHPECFTCHHCSTPLECISFYPEPDGARLERFQDALPHLSPDDEQIHSLASGVEDLHFFCHLDYHEQFSPRCHSCKTPVEGSVIMALGRHYHTDHFFCAECGDPFTPESPFVEHNNYPYCVSCHTKRTSSRCRACKKQILDEMTVEALGGKWHDACFVCFDCGGDFGDEGRFFVREIEVELTDKEKRRRVGPKFEERAACQACEETRLKNADIFL